MASSSNPHGAGRRISSSMENNPTTHTRKRTSRAPPSTQAMSDRLKHQQLRERHRALQRIRTQQQNWEMGNTTTSLAMTDPWDTENSIPMFEGVTLPRQLARAPFRMPRPETLAAIDPGLVDTNIEYIKDCMELRGEQMYASLRNTSILSLHKPHGPHYFPTSARVRIKHAHADLPTHLLAVRSSLPNGLDLADGSSTLSTTSGSSLNAPRPSAHYTPIHALTLAVYAPLVPALPPSDPSLQIPDDSDTDMDEGSGGSFMSSVDITLPVVVLRVPSPRTFGMLIAVLYSQRYDNLVKVLLGIPLTPPTPSASSSSPTHSSPSEPVTPPSPTSTRKQSQSQSSLFMQSIFSSLFSPLADLPPSSFSNSNIPPSPTSPTRSAARHNRLTARLTHMSRLLALGYLNAPLSPPSSSSTSFDKGKSPVVESYATGSAADAAKMLLRRTRLVQALAANARAMGVCDLAFWGTIDVAWAVLLGALGFVAGSVSASAPTDLEFERGGPMTMAMAVDVMDAGLGSA